MAVYLFQGNAIINGGSIGTNQACCCNAFHCFESTNPLSVTFSGFTSLGCQEVNVMADVSGINGLFIIPNTGPGTWSGTVGNGLIHGYSVAGCTGSIISTFPFAIEIDISCIGDQMVQFDMLTQTVLVQNCTFPEASGPVTTPIPVSTANNVFYTCSITATFDPE